MVYAGQACVGADSSVCDSGVTRGTTSDRSSTSGNIVSGGSSSKQDPSAADEAFPVRVALDTHLYRPAETAEERGQRTGCGRPAHPPHSGASLQAKIQETALADQSASTLGAFHQTPSDAAVEHHVPSKLDACTSARTSGHQLLVEKVQESSHGAQLEQLQNHMNGGRSAQWMGGTMAAGLPLWMLVRGLEGGHETSALVADAPFAAAVISGQASHSARVYAEELQDGHFLHSTPTPAARAALLDDLLGIHLRLRLPTRVFELAATTFDRTLGKYERWRQTATQCAPLDDRSLRTYLAASYILGMKLGMPDDERPYNIRAVAREIAGGGVKADELVKAETIILRLLNFHVEVPTQNDFLVAVGMRANHEWLRDRAHTADSCTAGKRAEGKEKPQSSQLQPELAFLLHESYYDAAPVAPFMVLAQYYSLAALQDGAVVRACPPPAIGAAAVWLSLHVLGDGPKYQQLAWPDIQRVLAPFKNPVGVLQQAIQLLTETAMRARTGTPTACSAAVAPPLNQQLLSASPDALLLLDSAANRTNNSRLSSPPPSSPMPARANPSLMWTPSTGVGSAASDIVTSD